MIQDIYPHKLFNQYIPGKTPTSDSLIFIFDDRYILCKIEDDKFILPTYADLQETHEKCDISECIYLFSLDNTECFLLNKNIKNNISGEKELPIEECEFCNGFVFIRIREIRRKCKSPRELIFALYTAKQLYDWYMDNKYCGRCGAMTKLSYDERSLDCPSCKRRIYPRINPAVIVGILNNDKMVVTKYAGRDIPYYALVAGFTEIGESLEETVEREVMEEVGLKVKNIRYYKSQPWGAADDILMGFFCDLDGDDTIHMDRHELKEAIWVTRDEIILQPDDYSLTNEMMTMFRDKKCS